MNQTEFPASILYVTPVNTSNLQRAALSLDRYEYMSVHDSSLLDEAITENIPQKTANIIIQHLLIKLASKSKSSHCSSNY